MSNRKGGIYERQLLDELRKQGYDAERLRLTGVQDEGDLLVRTEDRYVLEAKNRNQLNLAGWVEEAELEAKNYANHRGLLIPDIRYAVVIKRRNHAVGKSYVVTTLNEWLRQIA